MTGNVERAAIILGIFILFKYSHGVTVTIKNPEMITPAYCAGLKMGEAINEVVK